MAWELSIRDDLFALQHPEDGSEFTASKFYIIAENEQGQRFAHYHVIESARAVSDDEGFSRISSYREESLAKIEALLAKMKTAQAAGIWTSPVDRPHWQEIEPVYGSWAYIAAQPEIVAAERRRDLPF
jgi:hypothetical protein